MHLNERLRHISLADLAALGLQGVGYVKLVAIDAAAAYAVFAADGTQIGALPTRESALAAMRENGPRAGQRALRSGGVAGARARQQGVERVGLVGPAQLLADRAVAQQARDAGQRLQMIGAGRLGCQQQEDQIDRLLVDRIEIDRRLEPGEQAVETLQFCQLAVRDGDAVAAPRWCRGVRAPAARRRSARSGSPVVSAARFGEFLQHLLLA